MGIVSENLYIIFIFNLSQSTANDTDYDIQDVDIGQYLVYYYIKD